MMMLRSHHTQSMLHVTRYRPAFGGLEALERRDAPCGGWCADVAGDANLDGVFDSSDLVQIMSSGTYETGEAATWSEGDFNQDGKFDATDFIFAMQHLDSMEPICWGGPVA